MGRKIAKVAVARAVYAIDKPYDYLVPLELEGRLEPGMRVLVPFAAGNRGSDGLVLSLYEAPSAGESLKLIQAVLDDQPVLDARAIQLALWMRERCFCTVYDCVKAMLPAGLYFSLRDQVAVRPGVDRERAYRAAEGPRRRPAAGPALELGRQGGYGADTPGLRGQRPQPRHPPAHRGRGDRPGDRRSAGGGG